MENWKSWPIWFLLFAYVFFVSTLFLNFLQLLSLVIWPFDKTLYRKVNYYLAYASWCQFTSVGQWWAGCECVLHMDPEERKHLAREHMMVIMNHKYEIDWLMAWILAERIRMLGTTKIYGKKVLQLIPLIGWAWWFTESLFLKRDWTKDKQIIQEGVRTAVEYPDNYWVTLLLFPEGTRLTNQKLENSHIVAKEKGYPIMKHHLLPRPKGFAYSIQELKGKLNAVYDATVVFDEGYPSLMDVLHGKKILSRIRARRYEVKDLPDSEEELSEWLRNLFKEKDDVVEKFYQTKELDRPGYLIPKRYNDLVMHIFWIIVTLVPLLFYLVNVLFYGSLLHKAVIVLVFVLVNVLAKFMIGFTQLEKGSAYGKVITKKKAE